MKTYLCHSQGAWLPEHKLTVQIYADCYNNQLLFLIALAEELKTRIPFPCSFDPIEIEEIHTGSSKGKLSVLIPIRFDFDGMAWPETDGAFAVRKLTEAGFCRGLD